MTIHSKRSTAETDNVSEKVKIDESLTNSVSAKLNKLINKYKSDFQVGPPGKDRTSILNHSIGISEEKPIKQLQYRLPLIAKEEIARQVKILQENDLIEESSSPWCSSTLIVPKKTDDPLKP